MHTIFYSWESDLPSKYNRGFIETCLKRALTNLNKSDELKIDTVFQRLFRWDDERKTRFIESIILGIPLPPIFVFQNELGIWEFIGGSHDYLPY